MHTALAAALCGTVVLSCAMLSADASATTFGASGSGTEKYIGPCATTAVVSLAVSVDVPSRIFTNGLVSVQSFNAAYNSDRVFAELLDKSNTLVAYSDGAFTQSLSDPNLTYQLPSTGVLHDSNNLPYVALPGNYDLQLNVSAYGSCSGKGPYVWSSTLSYILLSSVLDRIFAAGFNAMVLTSSKTALIA